MAALEFDETVAGRLDVLYRTRDVLRRRALVRDALAPVRGERILDAGCGPGFHCAEIAELVGATGSVVGVDASAEMLAAATRRCADRANVTFRRGDVAALPVPDGEFDAAVCVQVLEYVADPSAALAELHRALRAGGRAVVWDVDWSTVSWHSSDAERMRRVLAAWDGHLAHPALPRTLGARLRTAGFTDVHMEGHVFATARLDPQTYGGAAATGLIAPFVTGRDGLDAAEVEAWLADLRSLDERGEFFFSCVQFCFSAVK